MQHISITKFNEDKIREMNLKEDSLNFVNVLSPFSDLTEEDRKAFPLISMVDPYDNTFLNHLQSKIISQEIENLSKIVHILDLDKIVERLNSIENLEYIVLRGD